MKDWHTTHMQKTVLKYVTGLSPSASSWEKRNHKRYGGIASMCRQIEYDIKHGATNEEMLCLFSKLRHDKSYSELRKAQGSMERLAEVEDHFAKPKVVTPTWYY